MNLFDYLLHGNPAAPVSPGVADATLWAIEHVEPQLRNIAGYPHDFEAPVANALEYARSLSLRIPGPLQISHAHHSGDPLLQVIFPTMQDCNTAFDVSAQISDYMSRHPLLRDLYTMVRMRREVKHTYGMEIQGGVLHRDVGQQAVNFSGHEFVAPGASEIESRAQIARMIFEALVEKVNQRVQVFRADREQGIAQREELMGQLREAPPANRTKLQEELNALLARDARRIQSLDLNRYAHHFEAVLLHPEQHVYLEEDSLTLDSMGVVRGEGYYGSHRLTFSSLVGLGAQPWTVMLLCCEHPVHPHSLADRIDAEQRWLGI